MTKDASRTNLANTLLELSGTPPSPWSGRKIVVFEGENSEFDRRMTARLFPNYMETMYFISAGSRSAVLRLHERLEFYTQQASGVVFSIVDRDRGPVIESGEHGRFTWDVYHVENYLLCPPAILKALQQIRIRRSPLLSSEQAVEERLKNIAAGQIDQLITHALEQYAYRELNRAIRVRGGPREGSPSDRVAVTISQSIRRLTGLAETSLGEVALRKKAVSIRLELQLALRTGEWKSEFIGREILKQFAHNFGPNVRYSIFRDLILDSMVSMRIQPDGMKRTLERIAKV